MKKKRYLLVGNLRVGDALGLAFLFQNQEYENWVICNRYNVGVFEFFLRRTSLNIEGFDVMNDISNLMSFDEYHQYCDKLPLDEYTDGEIMRVEADGDGNIITLPLLPMELEPAEEPYITLQVSTMCTWKNLRSLYMAQYPLKTKCITLGDQYVREGSEVVRNKTLMELEPIIRNAVMHIGVASSITRFASMLEVPTIMCHFSEICLGQGVEQVSKGNKDILTPNTQQVEAAVSQMLARHPVIFAHSL